LEKNKKYTVVGGSGSGKTTLVRLLCANYTGYTGTISFSGRELHELDINQLLTHIAFIHQNVYMFDESIKENISLHREYSEKEWQEALATSGVDRFLDQMENGLDTQVGENGINLSGGQRQRVAVARALIQKKPILIIDEGTSAVDRQTAYEIETALLAMPQITLITITHHLASELLRQYDRILFLQNGQVAESGTYDELIQKQAHFAEFTGV
ncbi:MAG: ABC transporter ATP-binding protein/permease, partial [Coriobacteriia bacterium]|nr:ABC transporter ATP-binding protein/permease [Coriobacteriia bacterium]